MFELSRDDEVEFIQSFIQGMTKSLDEALLEMSEDLSGIDSAANMTYNHAFLSNELVECFEMLLRHFQVRFSDLST